MRRLATHPALALCLFLAACGGRTVNVNVPDAQSTATDSKSHVLVDLASPDLGYEVPKTDATLPPLTRAVDILFVIDNSGSMNQEQAKLSVNFGALLDMLQVDNRELPNLHIGVVSTDLGAGNYTSIPSCEAISGDRGALQSMARVPGCPTPTDPWISYNKGTHNVGGCAGDAMQCVKDAFRCISTLGIEGCGFEMPLESARRAVDPMLNTNPGFLRDNALLAVIFLTDEDDCSAAKAQLFDPSQNGLSDPLGPLTSFRCFEFGIQCDINDRNTPGPRQGCVPAYDWL
ncbi:MAG: hypothetical protein JRH20_23050, partial [Deltaproteobacteria bacterium]|nr:hypothetical protein [Deltaproteobacteria bacterium]